LPRPRMYPFIYNNKIVRFDSTVTLRTVLSMFNELLRDLIVVCLWFQKNTVKTLFGGVITNNVVSLVRLSPLNLQLLYPCRLYLYV